MKGYNLSDMTSSVAIVYDWFDTPQGGAERVLHELHILYPHAVWFTSHVDPDKVAWASGWDIRTSFLQHAPRWLRSQRLLSLLLLPLAFESIALEDFDMVISVTSAFAKGVVTRPGTRHVCYLLTPPRWLYEESVTRIPPLSLIERLIRRYLQLWDKMTAQHVDSFVCISTEVAERCQARYGRASMVVYPPFDYTYWSTLSHHARESTTMTSRGGIAVGAHLLRSGNYFLVVSRLVDYKRVDLALDAYAEFKKRHTHAPQLVIVGTGNASGSLRKRARARGLSERDMLWLQGVTDEELAVLYTHCRALIMPQHEEFGYVACEAVACSARIVVYARGGQMEILQDYPLRVVFDHQTVEDLSQALEKVDQIGYNAETYENSHIRGWGRDSFVATFTQTLSQAV